MVLDQNYSASTAEKDYVKNTLETEGVQELFKKEVQGLQSKIINNFHSANYVKLQSLDKSEMKEIISKDPDMKAKYEAALAKNTSRGGFSEGMLLLQTLAIKCVTVLSNNEIVENKLQQRSELGHKSEAMDGILGPNTFYVLASIAKEKNIPFNGVVDQKLIDTLVDICLEDTLTKPAEQPTTITSPVPEVIPDNKPVTDEKPVTDNKPVEAVQDEPKEPETKKIEEAKPEEINRLNTLGTITPTSEGYTVKLHNKTKYNDLSNNSKDTLAKLEKQGYSIKYLNEENNEFITAIEITKKIENFENFENAKKNMEENISLLEIKFGDCDFKNIENDKKKSYSINYQGKEIIEIGIGIYKQKIQYFGTYQGKTNRSEISFDLTKIIELIERDIEKENNTTNIQEKQPENQKNKKRNKRQKRLD